jgi:hypothetical protein
MPRLPNLHLHRIYIDDRPLPLVVKGRSQAAVRDHVIEHHIRIERLTPEEAFQAGGSGAVIETVGERHDAQQNAPTTNPDATEPGLFDAPAAPAQEAQQADAVPRPSEGPGPGYVSALSEAATL